MDIEYSEISYLDGINTPDRESRDFLSGIKDRIDVGKVALDQLDFRGLLGELLGRGRGCVSGEGEDLKVGVFLEQAVDEGAALLPGGAGDENSARHEC